MEKSEVLRKRCHRFLERADRVWSDEDMEDRIRVLSSHYHLGHGAPNPTPDIIRQNRVRPRTETRVASMHARAPEVLVRPMRAGFEQQAMSAELLLNYLTRHKKYNIELREWLFYASLYHYGIMKLGMETGNDGVSLPMMRAWHPKNFRCDPTMDKFRPAEGAWQAFRSRRSFGYLEATGLYDETSLDRLREEIGKDQKDWQPDTVECWVTEHYLFPVPGKRNVQIMVSADGYNEREFDPDARVWIREEAWTSAVGLPGVPLVFAPSPLKWFPIALPEFYLDQLALADLMRTLKVRAAQRSIPKTLADAQALGDEGLAALESSHVKQIVPVKNVPTSGMKSVVQDTVSQQVSNDVIMSEIDADNAIQEIDGSSGVQLGRSEPERGSTSATRDSLIETNFRLRAAQDQERWEDALEDAYQRTLNNAQANMKGDVWVKTTGMQERLLNKKEIQLDADVKMAFGSTQLRDRQQERDDARELFALLVNNPGVNQAWLNRYLLQKQGDVKDIDGALTVGPPPLSPLGMPPGSTPGSPAMPAAPPDAAAMTGVAQGGVQTGQSALSLSSMFRQLG